MAIFSSYFDITRGNPSPVISHPSHSPAAPREASKARWWMTVMVKPWVSMVMETAEFSMETTSGLWMFMASKCWLSDFWISGWFWCIFANPSFFASNPNCVFFCVVWLSFCGCQSGSTTSQLCVLCVWWKGKPQENGGLMRFEKDLRRFSQPGNDSPVSMQKFTISTGPCSKANCWFTSR